MNTKHQHNWRVYRRDYAEGFILFDCSGCKSFIHAWLFRTTDGGYKADVVYLRWLGDRYGKKLVRESQVLCSNRSLYYSREVELCLCLNILGDVTHKLTRERKELKP